jgi:hypothetical protein
MRERIGKISTRFAICLEKMDTAFIGRQFPKASGFLLRMLLADRSEITHRREE